MLDTSSGTIAILPLGAYEQHGPHLPFDTDSVIAEGIANRLFTACDGRYDLEVLETRVVGYSPEHMDYGGSRTLPPMSAIEDWCEAAEDMARQGLRKIMLLNAHGGNSPLVTIAATEIRIQLSMLAVATKWDRFILPGDLISVEEKAFGIHGGDLETSVMLALAPDKVDMGKAQNFTNRQQDFAERYTHLRAYGPHAFGWKMQDLNPQGVTGDASAATAEKGELLIAQSVSGLLELLDDMARFDLTSFKDDV